MCSTRNNTALPVLGFPIGASAGQRLFSASPRLIAAVHALHRLLVPRHPPCALTILTVIKLLIHLRESESGDRSHHLGDTRLHWLLCSFQGPREGTNARTARRSLKTQQHAGFRGLELAL